jgi:hypothetical protein
MFLKQGAVHDLVIIHGGDEHFEVHGAEYIGLYRIWPVGHPEQQPEFHWFRIEDDEPAMMSVLPENLVSAAEAVRAASHL